MRMVKEMVKVLFSLMLGKRYVSVELEDKNKYSKEEVLDGVKQIIEKSGYSHLANIDGIL